MGTQDDPRPDSGRDRSDARVAVPEDAESTELSEAPATASRVTDAELAAREIDEAHRRAVAAGEPGYRDPRTGYLVFTSAFHIGRGYCCDSGCRHCPYRTGSDVAR